MDKSKIEPDCRRQSVKFRSNTVLNGQRISFLGLVENIVVHILTRRTATNWISN